jgi:hypothetical protein
MGQDVSDSPPLTHLPTHPTHPPTPPTHPCICPSNHPFSCTRRAWVAEENRHGDLMNKFCYLTGRVNMRAVEVTIQNLIGSGMDPKTENNPYLGFIYTSFQVRACVHGDGVGGWVVWCGVMVVVVGAEGVCSIRGGVLTCISRSADACRQNVNPHFHPYSHSQPPALPSLQERATKVSHGNTARHALEYGDDSLSKLCGAIAADESRHEIAYTRIVSELFK